MLELRLLERAGDRVAQIVHVQRLLQIVARAELDRAYGVLDRRIRGHHQDAGGRAAAPRSAASRSSPLAVGKAEVEQGQVGLQLGEEPLALGARGGERSPVPELLERAPDVLAEDLFVLDDQ